MCHPDIGSLCSLHELGRQTSGTLYNLISSCKSFEKKTVHMILNDITLLAVYYWYPFFWVSCVAFLLAFGWASCLDQSFVFSNGMCVFVGSLDTSPQARSFILEKALNPKNSFGLRLKLRCFMLFRFMHNFGVPVYCTTLMCDYASFLGKKRVTLGVWSLALRLLGEPGKLHHRYDTTSPSPVQANVTGETTLIDIGFVWNGFV